MRRLIAVAAVVASGALALAACSSSGATTSTALSGSAGRSGSGPVTVRLGYLANITHAPALVGVREGFFTKALGSAGKLQTSVFTSGTQETTAILAGQLDAAYVGPNPAINAWQKSAGTAIRVISGAATGGASIVVRSSISSASQLRGQSLATPSLGNTQDVALRYWLRGNGLASTTTGGGDVSIKPTAPNSAAVLEFKSGQIAGASEPAPYDIEMVSDGGHVLLREPGVTTLLVVTQSFMSAHPAIVAGLLKAQIEANDFISSNTARAEADANAQLAAYTGKPLKSSLIAAAFKEITFTDDPDEASLTQDAQQAESVGLLKSASVSGIFSLSALNTQLAAAGEARIGS